MPEPLLIGKTVDNSLTDVVRLPRMANRHGLIAGGTGTVKTITLHVMHQPFAPTGCPASRMT